MHPYGSLFVLATKISFLLDANAAPYLHYWSTMAKTRSCILLCLLKIN